MVEALSVHVDREVCQATPPPPHPHPHPHPHSQRQSTLQASPTPAAALRPGGLQSVPGRRLPDSLMWRTGKSRSWLMQVKARGTSRGGARAARCGVVGVWAHASGGLVAERGPVVVVVVTVVTVAVAAVVAVFLVVVFVGVVDHAAKRKLWGGGGSVCPPPYNLNWAGWWRAGVPPTIQHQLGGVVEGRCAPHHTASTGRGGGGQPPIGVVAVVAVVMVAVTVVAVAVAAV
eukprot:162263-Chlamydomonas_euryale.AAC.2